MMGKYESVFDRGEWRALKDNKDRRSEMEKREPMDTPRSLIVYHFEMLGR